MKHILFICAHNDARSQMAAAFLNRLCSHSFQAHSAGFEPTEINPFVVAVMKEIGFDLCASQTQHVTRFLGQSFDYVITVCESESARRCPVFPGAPQRLHWAIPDPIACQGTPAEQLARAREVRDVVKMKIAAWSSAVCRPTPPALPDANAMLGVKILPAVLLSSAAQLLTATLW